MDAHRPALPIQHVLHIFEAKIKVGGPRGLPACQLAWLPIYSRPAEICTACGYTINPIAVLINLPCRVSLWPMTLWTRHDVALSFPPR